MLSKRDLRAEYPAQLALTEANLTIAREAIKRLWNERQVECGLAPSADRSGSCKFAALVCRDLFGGRLSGNYDHMFVRADNRVIDLNNDQQDVLILGKRAHLHVRSAIEHPDYRASLGYCQARAKRWVEWVMQHPAIERSRHDQSPTYEPFS
ncbi:hypothetical protein RBE51_21565 [Pseudomonas taiwanensis]|uniref:hypothetical protein n=1 Tax=Pseudomonas taiwanensis TaxID=470150 RepID=UPI0028E010C0|nr:hypothetical protein [Pseudomonas taiwanensis]MDT8925388.1 hypothetical protein [Pseudomonas taiwanensis]